MSTIAVTGATGQLGRLVISALKAKVPANEIVALVRTPAKAADLGVAAREADYSQPATLGAALAGVDKLLLISGSEVGQRIDQHRNVVEAAKQAGVKHIVYTSLLRADSSPMSLAVEHKATEEIIKASGIAYTLLRNGWYIENYASSIQSAPATGAVLGSTGEGKIAAAARADYAEAAAAVLASAGHEGKVYELAGDHAFTQAELASEIARQTGKPVVYKDLPVAEYAATLASFGLPEPVAQMIAQWDVDTANGALFDDGHQLSALIGRPTTPLAEAVATLLK
ncbi:SDR family oxidoreductase [Chloroflexia bacterium SDU3-3]|nr:SDR family oxidoreductase [Chloroflexia bacterium SDU3-3]